MRWILILAAVVPITLGAQQPLAASLERAAASHPQPGDRIIFHVVGEPLLSDTVTVNERGESPFPKLGLVRVSDYSISALQDTLQARYTKYLRTPAIEIVVLRRIGVEGEVSKPSVYFVDVATTLHELVARAGGTTDAADRNKLWIVRQGNRIPIPNWQSDESVTADLHSGDQVVVGRKSWFSMNFLGAVGAAGVLTSILITLRR